MRCIRLLLVAFTVGLLVSSGADARQDGEKKKAAFERGQFKPSTPVLFEAGSDALRPESEAALLEVREALAARTDVTLVRVEVHTDSDGDGAANQALTEKRALAVARRLVALGIDCKRLLPVGFGSTKPVAENGTPEGKAQNRRVVFQAAELRGRLIGGMPADGGGKVAGNPCEK
jgi:OOP family OmpA-OmpF porin